jgi:hypothetical protein
MNWIGPDLCSNSRSIPLRLINFRSWTKRYSVIFNMLMMLAILSTSAATTIEAYFAIEKLSSTTESLHIRFTGFNLIRETKVEVKLKTQSSGAPVNPYSIIWAVCLYDTCDRCDEQCQQSGAGDHSPNCRWSSGRAISIFIHRQHRASPTMRFSENLWCNGP